MCLYAVGMTCATSEAPGAGLLEPDMTSRKGGLFANEHSGRVTTRSVGCGQGIPSQPQAELSHCFF